MYSKKIIYILFIFICASCDVKKETGYIDEGEINYKLVYLESDKDKPIISILPSTMTVKFNKHFSIQKVDGWLGFFSLTGISDYKKGKDYALLKILEKKYIYEKNSGEGSFGYKELPGMNIKYVNETKIIAGYKCKKALITLPDSTLDTMIVYYTDQINIKNPNWNNPFKQINGVLLEFQMEQFNIKTKITANYVKSIEVPDKEFEIPSGYKRVTKREMDKVINDYGIN